MRTQPTDLSEATLSERLSAHWGLTGLDLVYVPLGFGSHHWRARDGRGGRWFVTVDDHTGGRFGVAEAESPAALARAMGTAAALRGAGLTFVLAPVPTRIGDLVAAIPGTHYTVTVFPYVAAGSVGEWGAFADEADRLGALRLVAEIHRATALVPAGLPRTETLTVPLRDELLAALSDLDAPWAAGPYGEPARAALAGQGDRIAPAFATFDALVAPILADRSGWVVTHGEPHSGNVLRDADGGLLLVDWDTALFAPRERDLWMLTAGDASGATTDWSAYTAITGVADISADAIRAYRLHWDLAEVASYVDWFRRPHVADADTETAWGGFRSSLAGLSAVPD